LTLRDGVVGPVNRLFESQLSVDFVEHFIVELVLSQELSKIQLALARYTLVRMTVGFSQTILGLG